MTEHVHKWGFVVLYYKGAEKVFIVCHDNKCKMVLTKKMAEARLNEYETLKAATEELSAEGARDLSNFFRWYWAQLCGDETTRTPNWEACNALRAYANILEDNDER